LVFVSVVILSLASSIAWAQGGGATSSLSGVVVDSAGGLVPGATVVVKNIANGVTTEAVTNSDGLFSVPALDPGTYVVTISLSGFKTVVMNDVKLQAATPASVKAVLEVGNLSETIEVASRSELVQTQSATISSTIGLNQISNLPLVTRNALNFITFLPGIDTAGIQRDSTINGLPQSTINITIDGVNVQDNFNKTGDGFFAIIRPQLDQVEEVTVTGALPGAAGAGQGAVQIAFVTRSGSNQFGGSAYHYIRHPSLNTNYWFNERNNLDKNNVRLHQYGARVGGPIVLPGLYDGRGKAFFFFNHEEMYYPTEATRTRTMMRPSAEAGIFTYSAGGQTRTVDLLALAASRGQIATPDATIAGLLSQIRSAAQTTGNISDATDLNSQTYIHQTPATRTEHLPTTRLDFNLTDKHRLSTVYNYQRVLSDPDLLNNAEPRFPGLPNFRTQDSHRNSGSATLRSTFTSNIVNEARFGFLWAPVNFGAETTAAQFENQGGFNIGFGNIGGGNLTTATTSAGPSSRNASDWNVDNILNWQKGRHAIQFGGSFTQINTWVRDQTVVPGITIGFDQTNDPANSMFTTANFPGASNAQLNNARQLYALLTGRLTSINGNVRLNESTNQYEYLGKRTRRGRMNEFGVFAQDQWRMTPALTVNAGLRWELQLPFYPLNDVFSMSTLADLCGISGVGSGPGGRGCNLFQPGTLSGKAPEYTQYDRGNPGYSTDWNNFAPNIGLAWRPNVQDGWLRTLLGDPEQAVVRGGFSIAYNRNGIGDFTGVYGDNPGSQLDANRTVNNGLLVGPGESWPVLFRDRGRLGPPPFPATPAYPIAATINDNINIFDPEIEVTYSRSWSVGLQRAVSKDMAVEIRYVGTRNIGGWTTEDWNEIDIVGNGFFNEFRLAQANLQANLAAGRGGTFAYFGPGSGTSPLPTYLAYLTGSNQAGDPSRYTASLFTNSAWTGHLGLYEPDPHDAANDLQSNATRRGNALTAGVPVNFFKLNPHVDEANITRSASGTRYHSMQLEVKRRLSRGLRVAANYTYGVRYGTALDTLHRPRTFVLSTEGVRHAFKTDWFYEIPVGRGQRYGSGINRWLNGLIGNWQFNGTGRVQSGDLLSATGVRLVGMTEKELQNAFKIRIDRSVTPSIVYLLPQDIVDNTRRAFNTDPTSATGYGADGPPTGRYLAPEADANCVPIEPGDCSGKRNVFVWGPKFVRFDFSLKKRFPFGRKASFDFTFEMLNVFDNVNFNSAFNPGGGATIFQTNSAYTDINNTFDPGGRLGQIVWRLNW
jgi:hypothetical protein